mmetsp:Transcript_22797/g.61804  ORF Transcript_22797/g.61804 Transcript_22797/m.61804 type:complete len:219 (+) Transcript_22797:592-1248(+)
MLHAGNTMALVQGVVASTQGPDVSVGQPAHGTHAPIVERLESCPEHLGQHPALTAVEQDSQHKTGVDLGPGACRKRRVAQVGVNHRLLQPCKESRRSLDPVNHLRLARERAIHDGTQVSKALGERDYAAAVTVRYRTVRDPCVDRESGDIIHDQDARCQLPALCPDLLVHRASRKHPRHKWSRASPGCVGASAWLCSSSTSRSRCSTQSRGAETRCSQ